MNLHSQGKLWDPGTCLQLALCRQGQVQLPRIYASLERIFSEMIQAAPCEYEIRVRAS